MIPDYDNSDHDSVAQSTTGEVILLSLQIYGSVFLFSFGIYVLVRPWFPLAFNFCNSIREYNTKLAREHYGHIAWVWKIFQYSDEEIFENCGLTAAVFLRFLVLGLKIAGIGIFNSIYLMPVNFSGCNVENDECHKINDDIEHFGLGNVSQGNSKIIATTISAYVIFLSTLYLLHKEFEWFTTARHKFLSMPRVDNYSVYVAHIPMEYRGDVALMEYFKTVFDASNVVEAKIALDIKNLEKKVATREKYIFKLEHAYNLKKLNGQEPTNLTVSGTVVESIPFYKSEIETLNGEISKIINAIETAKELESRRYKEMVGEGGTSVASGFNASQFKHIETLHEQENSAKTDDGNTSDPPNPLSDVPLLVDKKDSQNKSPLFADAGSVLTDSTDVDTLDGKQSESTHATKANPIQSTLMKTRNAVQNGMQKTVNLAQDGALSTVSGVKGIGAMSVQVATNLIWGAEDGQVRDGGFVTFSSLSAKAQCVQMIHHQTPFTFQVRDAPLPKDIFWNNVGLSHKNQQIGFITAQILTATLCIFWTIPVTFITSLAEVESLKKALPSLNTAIQNYPWIEPLLSQLNPILVVILKVLIPVILAKISQREGHISQSSLNASVLTKLSLFLIIQIFFVPAISGSIFNALPGLIDDWREVMNLLATSVPGQVKFFIQFVIVNVFLSCSFELLRVAAVSKAFIRKYVGPNLSEKEKARPFLSLVPLTEPDQMQFPTVFADVILYIMILLVYSCIAPIMSYVMFVIFAMLLVTYRNQFIFIYSAKDDQGGVLWSKTMKSILLTIFIAQFTLIGVMTIKKSVLSSTLLIPLIIITTLFSLYLEQQHYKVTNCLPSTICKHVDGMNEGRLDKSFLEGQYIQPALKAKIVLPEQEICDNVEEKSECEAAGVV